MRYVHRRFIVALGACLIVSAQADAHNIQVRADPQIQVRPRARIISKINNAQWVSLSQTHPTRVTALVDAGRVASSTNFQNMMLVLKSSEEQEHALRELLDQQQDKTHANFHHWMTPQSFGAAFGLASSDIVQVKTWLEESGFTVTGVAKGGRVVQFSGTSGQVEAAFHTQMHQYVVNGETRISNSTDVAIPHALAPVVAGLSSLNNFRPTHSFHAMKVHVNASGQVTSATPLSPTSDTSVNGSNTFPSGHFVGGADLATVYNTSPLLHAGINGTGITIGIIGQTDVLLSDVQIYRSLFGLPVNNFHVIQVGSDPGTTADDGESDLDLEVSGAMAPNATINFYTSGAGYFGGGIDSAMEYVVEDNNADIISLSYSECEQNLGAGGNAFYNILYEQAAAQGQSIFVSTGDSGPDVCDAGSYFASNGYSVNGLASTPYNVAVGGTQFNEGATYSTPGSTPFWSGVNTATAPYTSALGYIPEQPWNESAFGTGAIGGLLAAGSGVSYYYPTPNYQMGPGVPTSDPNPPAGSSLTTLPTGSFTVAGPHRYLPDVSLNASVFHDGTIFCSEGSCTLTPTGGLSTFGIVGGTSVAAPLMAGAQALIDQANGGRQGVPNYYYYKLAATQNQIGCIATQYTATAGCAFHDSQTGNNDVPSNALATTEIGWDAGPQYDLAVGLGSPDVAHLASSWATVNYNATSTAFTLSPATSAHGTSVNVAIRVASASGLGTPSGNVSIVAQALNGSLGFYTLTDGAVGNGLLNGLPAGTYNVYARYAGDGTFGASISAPVQVTVSTEETSVAAATYSLSSSGALTAANSFSYGSNVFMSAGVASPSGVGVPTGDVAFTLSNGLTNLPAYVTQLDPNGVSVGSVRYKSGAFFDAGVGLPASNIASSFPALVPGTYTANITYSGDATFLGSKLTTPLTFVVTKAATMLNVKENTLTISNGASAIMTASVSTIASSAGGVPATGLVTFTDTTKNVILGASTLNDGAVTFTTNGLVSLGTHNLDVSYGGDSNYGAQKVSVTITVGGGASSLSLAANPAAPRVLSPVKLTATLPSGTTGTVSFFDVNVLLGTAAVSTTTSTATFTINTLIAGTHHLTAVYAGDATQVSSTSAAMLVTVAQNTPALSLSSQQASRANSAIALQALLTLSPTNGSSFAAVPPTGSVQYLDQAGSSTVPISLGAAEIAYQPGGYATYVASLNTSSLKPGYHTLSANYAGDANYAAASSNTQSLAVGITSLIVTSSTANVGTNIPFTLSAEVIPAIASSAAISGSVTFYDGAPSIGNVIGSASVSNGMATLSTASLSTVATHRITAVYSGDANFYTSTFSDGVSIVAVAPALVLSVSPSSLTLKAGNSGSVIASLTSFGNYSGSVAVSCIGLPLYTTCDIGYPTGGAQSITFSGTNTAQSATVTVRTVSPMGPNTQLATLLGLPGFFFASLLALRRKQPQVQSRQLLALALLLSGGVTITGCGQNLGAATPAGSYTVNVVANSVGTDTSSPNLQLKIPITLTVGY